MTEKMLTKNETIAKEADRLVQEAGIYFRVNRFGRESDWNQATTISELKGILGGADKVEWGAKKTRWLAGGSAIYYEKTEMPKPKEIEAQAKANVERNAAAKEEEAKRAAEAATKAAQTKAERPKQEFNSLTYIPSKKHEAITIETKPAKKPVAQRIADDTDKLIAQLQERNAKMREKTKKVFE